MLGMATNDKNSYPQKYFLIPEACRHFGLKPIPKGGKSRNDVSGGVRAHFSSPPELKPKPNIPGLTL